MIIKWIIQYSTTQYKSNKSPNICEKEYGLNNILCVFYRAATIVLKEDNCHFLRVDKDDFNRILRVSIKT